MFGSKSVRTRSNVWVRQPRATHAWPLRVAFLSAVVCLMTVGAPRRADAQYFGQNKVNYQTFKWSTLHTEHFDI